MEARGVLGREQKAEPGSMEREEGDPNEALPGGHLEAVAAGGGKGTVAAVAAVALQAIEEVDGPNSPLRIGHPPSNTSTAVQAWP